MRQVEGPVLVQGTDPLRILDRDIASQPVDTSTLLDIVSCEW